MSRFVASELVWVKLGGVQWPAVVKDKADCEEFLDALKRDPIAVVEFFDKKLHDVHNGNHICRYNCEEKEDIIMKSLQLTRNKPDISENFKKDVITAEKITDGDLHILSKSRFIIPSRKKHDDLFGKAKKSLTKPSAKKKISKTEEASSKKTSKYSDIFPESAPRNRKPTSKPKKTPKPTAESPRLNITHPRFIAENDHEIRILAADSPPAGAGDRQYRCSQCTFTTARLNVLVLHNKTHVVAAAAKRKTPDNRTDAPAAKRPKKKHNDAAPELSRQASGKADKVTSVKKTSRPSTPAKKSAAGETKKPGKDSSKNVPPADRTAAEKSKSPLKVSPLKPAGSSKPLLIDDWDEDDDEEVAERLKIQSEIDRFINDRRSGDGTSSAERTSLLTATDDSEERNALGDEEMAVELAADSAPQPGEKASAPGELVTAPAVESGTAAEAVTAPAVEAVTTPAAEAMAAPAVESVTTPVAESLTAPVAAESVTVPAVESVTTPAVESVTTPAVKSVTAPAAAESVTTPAVESVPDPAGDSAAAALRQRNDALLQAAVDDVLADTAPLRLPTLPPGAETPRPRPLRLCPPSDDVTSSPSDVSSSTTLPANLQILSVPGGAGQPDTYALVSVDDTGNVQTVNPMESLRGLGADTLLAYEVVQEDGSTRTAYLNPSALSSGSDIKHLLGGDGCKVDSSTPVPDSSGK